MARPMPVLPLVASTTVCPGLSWPDCSAASITARARRSFTELSGLNDSHLTNRFTPGGASRLIRTTGVLPIVSRMFAYRFAMELSPCRWGRSKVHVVLAGFELTGSAQAIRPLVWPGCCRSVLAHAATGSREGCRGPARMMAFAAEPRWRHPLPRMSKRAHDFDIGTADLSGQLTYTQRGSEPVVARAAR